MSYILGKHLNLLQLQKKSCIRETVNLSTGADIRDCSQTISDTPSPFCQQLSAIGLHPLPPLSEIVSILHTAPPPFGR